MGVCVFREGVRGKLRSLTWANRDRYSREVAGEGGADEVNLCGGLGNQRWSIR